jgi:hypothetical protein
MHWCRYSASSIDSLVSACKSVTDLTLDGLTFHNTPGFCSTIARFPSLKRLSVNKATFICHPSHLTPGLDVADLLQHTRPPNIHDLEVIEKPDHQTHILDWFSSHSTLVNSLSVTLPSLGLPSLNQYLQVLGPSLLFLQMNVRFCLEGASLCFLLIKRY